VGETSSQPASSKNHERRSSLTKMACADEKMDSGIVSWPVKALPRYRAMATRSSEAGSAISTDEDRAGTRIVTQRNAPPSLRPNTNSIGSDVRIVLGESRTSTRSE